jgi:tight adherence protein B
MMQHSLLILCGALVLITLTGGLLWHLESRRRQVAKRLVVLAPDATIKPEAVTIRRRVRREYGVIELVDKLVGRNAPLAAPLSVKTVHAVAIAVIASGIVFLLARSFLEVPIWIAAPAGLGAFLLIPRMVCAMALSNQRLKMLEQMPDALGLLVRAARSGMPVSEGVRVCANESVGPTADEFRIIADQVAVGTPLDIALEEAADRTGMPEYRFFVTAVVLQRETGGSLAETLDNLSEVIRIRKAITLKAKALSAEARMSLYVLAALPFFAVGALSVISPDYIKKLFEPDGKMLLGVAAILMTLGLGSMQLMIRSISR